MITTATKAIYLIHYFGFLQPEALALRMLCDKYGLFLIEDWALSLLSGGFGLPGSGQPKVGIVGDIALFCFYKFFPTVAGGALVINSDRLGAEPVFDQAVPLRLVVKPLLRSAIDMTLGAERTRALVGRLKPDIPADDDPSERFPDMPASYYFDQGFTDGRISKVAARQIRSFGAAEAIGKRRENYQAYLELLAGMDGLSPLFPVLPEAVCPLSMPVLVSNRNALAVQLRALGVAATPWWAGYHKNLDFSDQVDACQLKDHVLSLPCHQYLGPNAVPYICSLLPDLL
jgi:dTDP-4-amino-4,6-dideoxygalactose transaminase